MFSPNWGTCIECGDDNFIVVKKGWCARCNHKFKTAKKKAEGKSLPKKYVRKATGEKDVFEAVLEALPDDKPTTCFVCGKMISVVTHHNFGHILSKGRYPRFRLNPDNIRLMCFNIDGTGCHSLYDHHPKSELVGEGWDKLFELKAQLIEEYTRINE